MTDEDREVIALLVSDLAEPLRRAAAAAPPVDELDGAEAEAERYYRQALSATDPDAALGLVETALEHNGVHFNALYLRTILRAVKGEFKHVGPDANQTLLSFGSELPAGYIMRGVGRLCTGEPGASVSDFDQALELDPERPAYVLMFRGLAKLFSGDFEASRRDFERALELEPENASLRVGLGLYEALRGNFIQAQDTFDKAVAIAPEHAAARLERGRIRERVRRQLEQYSAVLESDPGNAVAWERRGDAHALLGDLARAESDYARAYEAYESKPARLFAKRGLCKLNREQMDEGRPGTGSRELSDTPGQPTSFPDWLRPVIP
jgi:tetratricopeptide (TPR) repeat protein